MEGEGEQETSRAQGSDRTARVLVVRSAARSMVVYGVHTRTIGPYSNPEVYCGHGVQSSILSKDSARGSRAMVSSSSK